MSVFLEVCVFAHVHFNSRLSARRVYVRNDPVCAVRTSERTHWGVITTRTVVLQRTPLPHTPHPPPTTHHTPQRHNTTTPQHHKKQTNKHTQTHTQTHTNTHKHTQTNRQTNTQTHNKQQSDVSVGLSWQSCPDPCRRHGW